MRSDICHLDKRGQGRREALAEAEKVAVYCGLGKKDALRLRLLAEELAGMMQGVAGSYSADFWIEAEDRLFTLFLASDIRLNREKRERLVAIASSGKNEAAKGIMGKLAILFETYIIGDADTSMTTPALIYSTVGVDEMSSAALWSLQAYRNELAANRASRSEEWDELEKSIVANLADEITVGVRAGSVEIRVCKRF